MQAIRDLRKERNMTMKQLGKQLGVSETAISYYETGRREPDLKMLGKIADLFGVSVDFLLEREKKNDEEREKFTQEVLANAFAEWDNISKGKEFLLKQIIKFTILAIYDNEATDKNGNAKTKYFQLSEKDFNFVIELLERLKKESE